MRLPQFQAQDQVQQRQLPVPDHGSQSLLELANNLQSLGQKKLLESQVQKAKIEGEEQAASGQPLQLPEANTEAQKAFNESALKTNKIMTLTQVSSHIPQLQMQAMQANPTDALKAYSDFTKAADEYKQHVLGSVPDQNKFYTENAIESQIGQSSLDLQKNAYKQLVLKRSAQFGVTDQIMQGTIDRAINHINFNMKPDEVQSQINSAGQYLNQRIQAAEQAQTGGLITPKQFENIRSKAIKRFNTSLIVKHFTTLLNDHPDKADTYLNQMLKSDVEGFSEKDKGSLFKFLKSLEAKYSSIGSSSKVMSSYMRKNYINGIKNGGDRDVNIEDHIKSLNPKYAPIFDQEVEDAAETYGNYRSIMNYSFEDQNTQLTALKPSKDDPDYGRKFQIYQDTANRVIQSNHLIGRDPVLFFEQNPDIENSILGNALQKGAGINPDGYHGSLYKPMSADPTQRLINAQVIKGIPPNQISIVKRIDAKKYVSQLNGADGEGKISLIHQWAQERGKFAPLFFRDLVKHGNMNPEDLFVSSVSATSPDRDVLANALNATSKELRGLFDKSTLSSKFDVLQYGSDDLMEQYKDSLNAYAGDKTSKHLSQLTSLLRRLTLSYMSNRKMDASDAKDASENMILGIYHFTTINGSQVRIPSSYDPNLIVEGAKQKEKELTSFYKNQIDPETKFRVNYGHWATNPDNTGFTWVDQNGRPITNKKGLTFNVSFKDIINNDHLRERVQQQEKEKSEQDKNIGLIFQLSGAGL